MTKIGMIFGIILILSVKLVFAQTASLEFDKNTVLDDKNFDVTNTWNKGKIQELFEKRNSFFKDYVDPVTGKLASEVIAERAEHYQISSKILLAKMQTESSSIWNAQKSREMMERNLKYKKEHIGKGVDWVLGFGRPDNAPPILKYKGFYNQVDNAAKLLSVAFVKPEDYFDAKGKKWSVGELHTVYDGTVTPTNRATVALYIYTPWIGEGKSPKIEDDFGNKLLYDIWLMMFGVSEDETKGVELFYDDGSDEGWGVGGTDSKMRHIHTVLFHSPFELTQLTEVKFYLDEKVKSFDTINGKSFYREENGLGYPCKIHVMDSQKNDIFVLEVTPDYAGWFKMDLSSHSLTVPKDFFVGIEVYHSVPYKVENATNDYFYCYVPVLSMDNSKPDGKSWWEQISSPGEPYWTLNQHWDYMIRVVINSISKKLVVN